MALVCYSHKCIFVHIPKTGGGSIRKALNTLPENVVHNHVPASRLRRYCGKIASRQFRRFCFVRNPWDRMVSYYFYQKQRHPRRYQDCSFEDWVLRWDRGQQSQLRPYKQILWFTDTRGKIIVDYVGRFECLQEEFDKICQMFGFPPKQLTRENRSVRRPYQEMFTDETREYVAQESKDIIDMFGYKF